MHGAEQAPVMLVPVHPSPGLWAKHLFSLSIREYRKQSIVSHSYAAYCPDFNYIKLNSVDNSTLNIDDKFPGAKALCTYEWALACVCKYVCMVYACIWFCRTQGSFLFFINASRARTLNFCVRPYASHTLGA